MNRSSTTRWSISSPTTRYTPPSWRASWVGSTVCRHDVEDRAIAWLEQAAERSARAEAPVVAVRLYTDGLHLIGDGTDERRTRFLLGRARAYGSRRELLQARADASTALEEAEGSDDGCNAARALLVLADLDQKEYRWAEADEHLRHASEQFADQGDQAGVAEALRLRGFGSLFRRDYDAARSLLLEARSGFEVAGDRRGAAWALQNLAWCEFYTGRTAEAEALLRGAIEEFSELGDRGGLGWATGLLAWTRLQQGDRVQAQEIGDKVLADIRGGGDRWAVGVMLSLAALTRLWGGKPQEAVVRAEEAYELSQRPRRHLPAPAGHGGSRTIPRARRAGWRRASLGSRRP